MMHWFLLNTFLLILYELNILKVSISPLIDGNIEKLWFNGIRCSDFIQWEPNEGELPTETTIVWILYDKSALYFAFKCYDSGLKNLDVTKIRYLFFL